MKKQFFYYLLSCTSLCTVTAQALEVSKTYVPKKKACTTKSGLTSTKMAEKISMKTLKRL